jgi:subtilisin family serine protease
MGGPSPSDHATAIASLLRAGGVTRILSADVYGKDPAGGNALAMAQALDWFAREKVPVVSVSLVGPRNLLLERAIAAASARGMTIVAAVGNDGPAAPPAFPASYPSVLAITGVDGRERALIEAGHALHLDYAAPGADMKAPNVQGRDGAVRGTSYAVPFVAARAAAAVDGGGPVRTALDAEVRDLGRKGPDDLYGRGLICGNCAPR